MGIEIFRIFYFSIFIIHARGENRIGPNECKLEDFIQFEGDANTADAKYKQRYLNESGMGVINFIKIDWSPVLFFRTDEELKQICLCVAKKSDSSFTGDISSIEAENRYYYCRLPCYASWQSVFYLCLATIKCVTSKKVFFIVETRKVFWKYHFRNLFILELLAEELETLESMKDKYGIYYPTGTFRGILPEVDFRPFYNT